MAFNQGLGFKHERPSGFERQRIALEADKDAMYDRVQAGTASLEDYDRAQERIDQLFTRWRIHQD